MRWISKLTTIAIVLALVLGVAMLIRSKLPNALLGGQFETHAMFRDASRLQVGSPVVIAGVRIGDITKLMIAGRFARVEMRLRENINLPVGTFATKKADSLFGDSYVELIPAGAEDTGNEVLKSGEPIRHVMEGGSTDATLRAIARTLPKIDAALDTIHDVMLESRRWINGPVLTRMRDADHWLAEGNVERPLVGADRALERFERGTSSAAAALADARPGIERRIAGFDKSLVSVRGQLRDAKQALTTAFGDARTGFARMDQTVDDMREVMSAIEEGRGDDWRGTLGRLINDPALANTLQDVTGDLAEGAAGLNRFRSWVGGRVEVSVRTGDLRGYATAELNTKTDRFYLLEFSLSQLGAAPASDLADATGSNQFTRTQEIGDKFRFTAQFGKRIGLAQLRAGIKDSTPGVGVDALFGNGRLRLSADLFGSFDRTPRLKLAGALAVFRTVYVLAGVDDVLTAPGELPVVAGTTPVPETFTTLKYGRDYFLGASLHFTDADLAAILRAYGAVLTGFLLVK
jgi:phospholipid/cholesterol/gamma-HCH transport system substrate-binding protein